MNVFHKRRERASRANLASGAGNGAPASEPVGESEGRSPSGKPVPSRWWQEPLIHFLVIGALLFLAFHWWSPGGAGSSRIVITPGQVDAITAAFARTWQRPPTDQEVKGLLDEYLREEIAAREAMALGLDRDDTVIRRRLRQKYEFAAEDTVDATPPTDAELQAWLDAHPASFTQDAQVSFLQVFLDPERRGGAIEEDARRLRDELSKSGAAAVIEATGDSVMLPHDIPGAARTDVAQQFGEGFADALLTLPVRTWTGPIRSGYGVHLVYVRERQAGRLPALAEIRPLVERELTADRRRRHLDALYAAQLGRYHVVIERRSVTPGTAEAATLPGGPK